MDYFIGLDLGTSGARICVIDKNGDTIYFQRATAVETRSVKSGCFEQNPQSWWDSVACLLGDIPSRIKAGVRSIAVDGTSGTVLLCDKSGKVTSPALMYHDNRAILESKTILQLAPSTTGAQGTGSSLSKLLWLLQHDYHGRYALHQADWICGNLRQNWGFSDCNNALKLGYDPVTLEWPAWLEKLPGVSSLLPQVTMPGDVLSCIDNKIATDFGLPADIDICAGTTDSIAGFIATSASKIGDAVTSLGSTMVVKVINDQPVFAPEYGVYSHRLGDQWLVGGASNTGGAVLEQYFTREEMDELTPGIAVNQHTNSQFYPLPAPGERFPVNDPEKQSEIEIIDNRQVFFQAFLEGIASIEKLAYEKLAELGCVYPLRVITTGGGAKNTPWRQIRSQLLRCPVTCSQETEAAYGSAILAGKTFFTKGT